MARTQVPGAAQKNIMKAIAYDKYGPPEVLKLRDVSKPTVKNGQVLVRIRAAAVSPGDWFYLRGEPYVMRIAIGLPADYASSRQQTASAMWPDLGEQGSELLGCLGSGTYLA